MAVGSSGAGRDGRDAAEPGESRFGVQAVRVVAGGDEGGQAAVEVIDLGLECEPASGEAAQRDFGGGLSVRLCKGLTWLVMLCLVQASGEHDVELVH
ncbi:hypothetical protein, partial [Micromonospora avicenniae]|uniref:hypothetical protein n=1 Tax=Micromonospora avicenniae TaxID=1198245 RepID=UPI003CCB965A